MVTGILGGGYIQHIVNPEPLGVFDPQFDHIFWSVGRFLPPVDVSGDRITPIYKPWKRPFEGEQPDL